jgi:hypothetical protein
MAFITKFLTDLDGRESLEHLKEMVGLLVIYREEITERP